MDMTLRIGDVPGTSVDRLARETCLDKSSSGSDVDQNESALAPAAGLGNPPFVPRLAGMRFLP